MTLDVFQMQQCENQGRLFESLDRRDIDAKAFIKAFMNSRAAAGLDSTFDHFQWAGNEYIYEDVVEEFGLKPMPNPPRYVIGTTLQERPRSKSMPNATKLGFCSATASIPSQMRWPSRTSGPVDSPS